MRRILNVPIERCVCVHWFTGVLWCAVYWQHIMISCTQWGILHTVLSSTLSFHLDPSSCQLFSNSLLKFRFEKKIFKVKNKKSNNTGLELIDLRENINDLMKMKLKMSMKRKRKSENYQCIHLVSILFLFAFFFFSFIVKVYWWQI